VISDVFSGCLVEEKLGEGGMGAVFLATRKADGRRVALKFLPPHQAKVGPMLQRFVRTAELVQRVNHANVAKILTIDGDAKLPHFVMEYVKGEPLDARLKRVGKLSPPAAIRVARDMAHGLEAAHRAGLLHRDVKPGNILLTSAGRVKVIDFGIGRNTHDHDGITFAGEVLGTPSYMAPEQWGAHQVDHRCDVYSLGATLYHLATGRLPFRARRPTDLGPLIAKGEFPRPRDVDPDLPEDLELVIYRLMAVERDFRYQSMYEAAEDLQRLLEGRSPNLPRLEQVVAGKRRRFPLLPGTEFRIGRKSSCRISIPERTVSREHAEVVRDATGYVFRDLKSSSGSFVRDSRVQEVRLKDMDTIRLGKLTFVFRDGRPNLASSSVPDARRERQPVQTVSEPLLRALVEAADRRVVLTLIERLAPGSAEARADASRRLLGQLLGPEVGQQVAERMLADAQAQRARLPTRLFMITHEKLGERPNAWLAWWDRAWTAYPQQVGPSLPPYLPEPRLRVLKGGSGRVIDLSAGLDFLVGRETQCDVVLKHGSVSRQHATVLRLHERLAIRDEGSRLGTVVDGERVQVAFLQRGSRVNLGKIKLSFEEKHAAKERPPRQAGAYPIDPQAFDLLVELSHPSTARALVGFLQATDRQSLLEAEAKWLYPDDAEGRSWVQERAKEQVYQQAQKARKLLPKVLKTTARRATNDWKLAVQRRAKQLGPQVLPTGWSLPL
jgi:serine/threonine protein kinase